MKHCPTCGTAYTDESLSYCLADGSVLVESPEQKTFVKPAGDDVRQMRIDIPREQFTRTRPEPEVSAEAGSSWLKMILLVGLVLAMLVGAVGIAGALIYFNRGARTGTSNSSDAGINGPTPSPSAGGTNLKPHGDADPEDLRAQIANLEKKIDEQKRSGQAPPNVPDAPDQPLITSTSATVNSPSDGFLALRTLPSSDIGQRIAQVPDGARVSIGGCLARSRVGNKTGRWCRATYNGRSGWLFDAWLVY